jgi:hypothetical protein
MHMRTSMYEYMHKYLHNMNFVRTCARACNMKLHISAILSDQVREVVHIVHIMLT